MNHVTVHRRRIQANAGFIPFSFDFGARLRRVIEEFRPDILHLHLPSPVVFSQLWIPKDIPIIIHWHADVRGAQGFSLRFGYPVYSYFEKAVLRRAVRIIATSDPYLEYSPTLRPFRAKCRVVPLGLDPQRLCVAPSLHGSGPSVLSVGRLAIYKGFENLIRAARLLPHSRFEIIGKGPCRGQLEKEIHLLGLEDRVKLSGYLPDSKLQNRMAQADIFCLPSVHRSEAFGMVLLEAMCHGKPLVSTSIPGSGTGWVNKDGETGYVVPPGDVTALADALGRLLSDSSLRSSMGNAARIRFEKYFHIQCCAETIARIYGSALQQ